MQLKTNSILISLAFLLSLLISIGCSHSNPATPAGSSEPIIRDNDAKSENLLAGMWNISFDMKNSNVEIVSIRETAAHYNVTDLLKPPNCDDCLEIVTNSFDPVSMVLDLDVTIKNPTALNAYDIRGILHTNDAGHELLNADDWTGLYDMPGGELINPFKAFCKDQASRLFAPDDVAVENYQIKVPDPPDYFMLTYAITASFPGNCREPYSIANFSQSGQLYDTAGSEVDIQVDVFDWQYDVNQVAVSIPEITGEASTPLSLIYATTWGTTLTNSTGAAPGNYEVKITAGSTNSGSMSLIDFATVTVTEGIPANPIDVTPPGLQFENVLGVDIEDGHAYVADYEQGLVVADIDPLSSAYIKFIVDVPFAWDVAVHEGYAYVIDFYGDSVHVIDIDPPETSYIVCMVQTTDSRDIAIAGNFAYIAAKGTGLYVMDITNPMNTHIISQLPLGGQAFSVAVEGNYAYVANRYGNSFQIVDISDPFNPVLVFEMASPFGSGPYDVALQDGMAYLTDYDSNLAIVDIDPPLTAYVLTVIGLTGSTSMGIDVSGGYAYVGTLGAGPHIDIVDINPVETAYCYNTAPTMVNPWKVVVEANYAYVADQEGGLRVIQLW